MPYGQVSQDQQGCCISAQGEQSLAGIGSSHSFTFDAGRVTLMLPDFKAIRSLICAHALHHSQAVYTLVTPSTNVHVDYQSVRYRVTS